ncbi:MAG: CDP-diacylglycerol--glycerol-3-phosphate 3-phosphatidyltransferase [Spirochaetaceae bacterium]|jgi:CDP-diacylglycerol--glycerol-3-phosphate 3-phosphatidyltransferase|nr:CDP-diacylglycerol--glycerol-3-phosphate 3-phosphatidyltransferase [Spirochaetaceae bacterium]
MTLADKITSLRLILAPVFFIMYIVPPPGGGSGGRIFVITILWVLFIVSELTDLIDGWIARRRREVSNFGKLFDPFADVLVRITYFLCFVVDGILPVIPLLIILYREFGILFVRILMMQKGIAMGARMGGKIKAVVYMVTGALALCTVSVKRLGLGDGLFAGLRLAGIVLFVISAFIAVLSFADYITVFRKSKT